MKATYIVALLIAAVAASVSGKAVYEDGNLFSGYSCSGKPTGNYLHPTDCAWYIACTDGGIAYEMPCAPCHAGDSRCIADRTGIDRTVYDDAADACLYNDQTVCHTASPPPPPPTTTTPAPPPTTTTPAPPPTTNTPPTSPPTTQPTTTTPDPDTCDPAKCKNKGDCENFCQCSDKSFRWECKPCPYEYFFEDLDPSCTGAAAADGGQCRHWSFLCPETQKKYRGRKDCLACYWKETGECKPKYWYQAPDLIHKHEQELSCSGTDVFDPVKERCRPCQDVVDSTTGDKCCEPPTTPAPTTPRPTVTPPAPPPPVA